MTSGFTYQKNILHADGVSLETIAEEYGTPLYLYSGDTILENFRRFQKIFHGMDCLVAYSIKSNSNLAIASLLNKEGAGFDIVSGGELDRVKKLKIPGERVIFAGVGNGRRPQSGGARIQCGIGTGSGAP